MAPRDANVPSGGSSGKSKPARAGWRTNSARTPAPDRGAVSRSWWNVRRNEPTRDAGFRAKLAVSIVLLATLVAAFVIFLRDKPTKVPMIALAATYRGSHMLPPNSWTIEDFERFEGQLANRGPGGFLSAEAGLGEVDVKVFRDDWIGGPRQGENALVQLRDLLKPVVPGGPKNDVVLIYISAHGVVNKDGEPCLLLEDSEPFDAATWLPVRSLCERICEVKPDERTRNVLILDCNRMEVSGDCGLLYNSFAEQLKELVENKLDKKLCRNLVVLNSTDPGEVAWAAPELGGSAFGYFFCQALSGAADRDGDGELSLNELNEYLRRRVDRWVVDHRSGSQRPMEPLFVDDNGDKQDFPLAYCSASGATPVLADAETRRLDEAYGRWHREQDWDAVANLWILHDKLRDERLYRVDPLAWAAFERGLLRLEQLLLAGKAYERECRELPQRLRQAVDAAAQKRQQDVAVYNLPLVGQFTTVLAAAEAKPEPISAEPDPAEAALSPRDRYYRQANKAWSGLLKKNPITPQDAIQSLGMIKEPLGKDAADLVEVHFLRVLGRYLDKPAGTGDDLFGRAVRSRQQAERTATPADERVQYWTAKHLDKGDVARRDAEDLLFVGAPAADDKNAARADFDQHEKRAWQTAEDDYLTAQSLADETGKAFDLRDRGWARAPYLALWQWGERIRPRQGAAARAEESQSPEQWGRLMSVVERLYVLSHGLDESLAAADQPLAADAGPAASNVWKLKDTEKLNEDLRLLESAFEAISIRLDDEGKQQENLVKIERHLALPLVAASHRNSLRERFLALLHDKYEANKRSPGDPQSGLSSTSVDQKETSFSRPDLLGGFPNHPFVELLKVKSDAVAEKPPAEDAAKPTWAEQLGQLAAQGDKVRTALGALTANVTTSLDESRKQLALVHDRLSENPERSAKALELKKIADVRQGRSDADRLVRAAAALCDLENVADPSPELRKFDLHQLMLRQCQRTLDDFWGPADASGRSYFERVAQDYLRAAEALCREPDAVALRAHCAALLARRSKAARTLLTAASTEDVSIRNQEQELVQLPLAVRRRSDDLPRGVAAAFVMYIDGKGGELVPLTKRRPGSAAGTDGAGSWIRRIGVPTEGAPAAALGIVEQKADGVGVDYWFKPESARTALEAVVCYRGHELRTGIEIAPPGVRVVYEPKRPPAPSVRVRGDEKVPTSVMFIFDCSASMYERDFPRGDGTTVRRLDGARDTLVSILKQPSLRQFRGVGLRIYGHRFGQNKKGEVQLSKFANAQRQRALAAGTPFAQRHPGADVELVFPSEFLDQQRRDEMISTLGSLESWGFTPLYLAISEAVNDPRPKDERRRIIAITDGFNEQGGVGIESQVTAKSLEDLLVGHPKVTLDIIGFGNEFSRDTRKAQDLADMKRVAARQGGGFYQAATAGDLLKRILKSLSLGKFEVVPAGSPPTDAEKFELENETWRGEEPPRSAAGLERRPKKYDVRVVEIDSPEHPSMPIELEGGEALELYLERAGNTPRLAYRYYDPDRKLDLRSRDTAAVDERLNLLGRILPPAGVGIRDRGKYWVASITPAWQSQERLAKFFISIQNYNKKFSPRPAEAWIEITPINEDGAAGGAVYRFCDLDFSPGRPVPVLECEARRFPHDNCKKARTQVWFSMEPTRGDAVVIATVADLKKREEIIDGVRISADVVKESNASVAVRIREQRMENETGKFQPGRVKIQMSPLPLRVEHDYDARRHTFYFEQDAEVDDFIVRLTSVEKFKKEAISGTLPETEVGR